MLNKNKFRIIIAHIKSTYLISSFLIIFMTNLQGAEHSGLPVVNVVASHLSDIPTSVKNALITVTAEEIDRRKPRNIIELLKTLPGVDASQSGSSGGRSYVSIRGGDPNFTLFLLNGIKINNPTDTAGGGVDLAFINPSMIERVEVYPGGLSSIHGAGSLGGIISITTKDQSMDSGFNASIRKGSDNTSETNFSAASQFSNSPHTWGLSGSYLEGGDITSGGKHLSRNISGTVELEIHENLLLTGQIASSNGYAIGFPEDSGGFRLSTRRETEKRDQKNESGSLKLLAGLPENWILSAQASIYNSHEKFINPGIAAGILTAVPAHDSDTKYQRNEFSMAINHDFTKSTFSIGGDYTKEQGASVETIDLGFPFTGRYKSSRKSIGLYSELSVSLLDELTLDGSARHETSSSSHDADLFRMAATYQLTDIDSTLQASWSEGYKLPSLFALGSALVGNSSLKPETSDTYEIRFSSRLPSLRTGVNFAVFRSEYRDLIDFDSTAFKMVNRDRVRVNGAEISMTSTPLSPLSLVANLSYSDAKIISESTQLRRRPLWKGNISAQWAANKRWDMRLDASYTGQFHDSSVPTGMIKMPAFWSLDALVNLRLSDNTAINLKITNLLNDSHEESIGFPSPGREAFLTFTTHL